MARKAGRVDLVKVVKDNIVHSASDDLARIMADGEVATDFMYTALSRGTVPYVRAISGYGCFDRADVGYDSAYCRRTLHTEDPDPIQGFRHFRNLDIKNHTIEVPMSALDFGLIRQMFLETRDDLPWEVRESVTPERLEEAADMLYAGRDSIPVNVSARLELYVKDPEFMQFPQSMQGRKKEGHPWSYFQEFPRGKGQKKSKRPFETLEQMEEKQQHKDFPKDFLVEETAGPEEMPVLLFVQPASAEAMARYVHKPERPEMTWADVYDVVHCRGQFSGVRKFGFPCSDSDTKLSTKEIVPLAIEYLLSIGFKPNPDIPLPS